MTRATLLALALLMEPRAAAAADQLWAFRLGAGLGSALAVPWPAGGRLLGPPVVLPGGEVAAVVGGARGAELCRWSAGGEPRGRFPLGVEGEVRALRPAPDGELVVVTSAEVLRVGLRDGKVRVRRRHGLALDEQARVAAAPDGVWATLPDRLAYAGLDGATAAVALPLAPGAAAYRADQGLPLGELVVGDDGSCLLTEWRITPHPVKGRPDQPDRPRELLLSLVSRGGQVLAQRALGEARSRREWFWRERGHHDFILPEAMGVVRTRWEGGVSLAGGAWRPGGDLVLVLLEEGRNRVVRLDGRLAERWSRAFPRDLSATVSPPWAPAVLVVDGASGALGWDEDGGAERAGTLALPPDARPEPARGFAIGPGPDGGWLVVRY